MKLLSRTEEMILIIVCNLQDDAFGLNIRDEAEATTGRKYSIGGIYVPLERLEKRGFLKTENEKGASSRLGRPRRRYLITAKGIAALSELRSLQDALWSSLPDRIATQLKVSKS